MRLNSLHIAKGGRSINSKLLNSSVFSLELHIPSRTAHSASNSALKKTLLERVLGITTYVFLEGHPLLPDIDVDYCHSANIYFSCEKKHYVSNSPFIASKAEQQLQQSLFKDHDATSIPIKNVSEILMVNFDIALRSIQRLVRLQSNRFV